MKKVVTTVIAGLIGIICFGQTPIKKVEKFPNGKIEHEYYVIEYKKIDQTYHTTDITHRQVGGTSTKLYLRHGSEKLYWDNGNMQIETNYYKNLYNGTYKRYHYNGKIAEEGTWSYGTRKGVHKFYDSNGNLREEIDFSNSGDYTKGTYKLLSGDEKIIAEGKLHQKYYSKAPDKKDSELALIHGEANYAEIVELTAYDNEGNKTFYAEFSETHPLRIYRYKEYPESFKNLFVILKFIKYENATFTKYQLYPKTDKLIVDYTASLDKNNNPTEFNYKLYYGNGKVFLNSLKDETKSGTKIYHETGNISFESTKVSEPFALDYERFLSNIGQIVNIDFNKILNGIIEINSTHYYPNGKIYQKVEALNNQYNMTLFDKEGKELIKFENLEFSKYDQVYEPGLNWNNGFREIRINDVLGFHNAKTCFSYAVNKKYIKAGTYGGPGNKNYTKTNKSEKYLYTYHKNNIYKAYERLVENLENEDDIINLSIKMLKLIDSDTKDFEKTLKKEKYWSAEISKLKELFDI